MRSPFCCARPPPFLSRRLSPGRPLRGVSLVPRVPFWFAWQEDDPCTLSTQLPYFARGFRFSSEAAWLADLGEVRDVTPPRRRPPSSRPVKQPVSARRPGTASVEEAAGADLLHRLGAAERALLRAHATAVLRTGGRQSLAVREAGTMGTHLRLLTAETTVRAFLARMRAGGVDGSAAGGAALTETAVGAAPPTPTRSISTSSEVLVSAVGEGAAIGAPLSEAAAMGGPAAPLFIGAPLSEADDEWLLVSAPGSPAAVAAAPAASPAVTATATAAAATTTTAAAAGRKGKKERRRTRTAGRAELSGGGGADGTGGLLLAEARCELGITASPHLLALLRALGRFYQLTVTTETRTADEPTGAARAVVASLPREAEAASAALAQTADVSLVRLLGLSSDQPPATSAPTASRRKLRLCDVSP
jgi:hypothetical protein